MLAFTTSGYGHFLPMLPLIGALRDAGHRVACCGPESFRDSAQRAGLEFLARPDIPAERLAAVFQRMRGLSLEDGNRLYLREVFGDLNLEFGLTAARHTIASWRPDVVLAEEAEVTSLVAVPEAGVRQVQVAIGLAGFRAISRAELGAAVEAAGHRMEEPAARLTSVPKDLDTGDPPAGVSHRYRDAARRPAPAELPRWWRRPDDPLVYMTLGSEAGRMELFPGLVGALFEAVAGRPLRVLFTTGSTDVTTLPAPPANVHVESWFSQDSVMPHAAAVVAHGGFGTMMSALSAGVPMVNLPLFALDQHWNAARLDEVGAGIALSGPDAADRLGSALDRVLADRSYTSRAEALAAQIAALPPPSATVPLILPE